MQGRRLNKEAFRSEEHTFDRSKGDRQKEMQITSISDNEKPMMLGNENDDINFSVNDALQVLKSWEGGNIPDLKMF